MADPLNQHPHAMDHVIAPPLWKQPAAIWTFILLALLIGGVALKLFYNRQNVPLVKRTQLEIITITPGPFRDSVASRATLDPMRTSSIDSAVSGIVETVLVRNGEQVESGQVLATLNNPQLDMQNLQQRSLISDRLSALDSRDLELKKSLVTRRAEIRTILFDKLQAQRELEKNKQLHALDIISPAALEQSQALLDYQNERLRLAEENFTLEEKILSDYTAKNAHLRHLAEQQLVSLERQSAALKIRASISGVLTGMDLTPGQQIERGTHIGTIDDETRFGLIANIDEFHLSQIDIGTQGLANINERTYPIEVYNINPAISAGQFTAKLKFTRPPSSQLKRGQNVNITLSLPTDNSVLSIDRTIYDKLPDRQSLYVLTPDGNGATRQNIRFGRKNKDQVEITDGVNPGDAVIIRSDIVLSKDNILIR